MKFKKVKLKDISKNNRGYYGIGASAIQYDKNKYTYLRITDINDDGTLNTSNLMSVDEKNANEYLLQKNDIVFARTGASTGRNYFYDGEIKNLVFAGFLIKFSLEEDKINPRFVKYYCSSQEYKKWIASSLTGSTRPNINERQLSNMPIIIPSREYQNKVVKILDSISKKIKLNNQINDNLLKLNDELYEKYFIDNVEENIATIELKNLITVVKGYSYKGNELAEESNIGMATIKNFERKGGFKEEGFKALKPTRVKAEQIVEISDILVACTDLTQQADIIGNAILLLGKAEFEKIVISMDLVKIIPKEGINKFIIYSILNSREFKNFALGYKSGTTVLHLNKKCFNDFKIKLPNEDALKKFSKIVENNYKKVSNILEENRRLEKLRDTLLPKLMNGEIDLDKV